ADKNSEAGLMPDEKLLTEMGKYNEELAQAGIMLAGEGLHPTSKGARVKFAGGKHTVTNGPFHESKDLIAGFWIWRVKSKDEAIAWVKRAVARVTLAARELLNSLVTNAPSRNRETEVVKARARSAKRFGAAPVARMAGHNHD